MSANSFFIASSTEAMPFVEEVTALVEDIGGTAIDWNTYFEPGDFILEKLLQASEQSSMAIIIVTPDDTLHSLSLIHI